MALAALFIAASVLVVAFVRAGHPPVTSEGAGGAAPTGQISAFPGANANAPVRSPAPPAPLAAPEATTEAASTIDAAVTRHPAPLATAPAATAPRSAAGSSPARSRAAPAPSADAHPAPAPPPKAEPPKREVDCSSPYFIDDQGMKKIRSECL